MITTLLLNFVYYTLNWAFELLPKVTSMPEWYDVIHENIGVFSALNAIPVISTMFYIGSLAMFILISWQGIVFTNWVVKQIRGSG